MKADVLVVSYVFLKRNYENKRRNAYIGKFWYATYHPIPAPPEFSATPEAPHEKYTSSRVTEALLFC